jgi:hypothetical protein
MTYLKISFLDFNIDKHVCSKATNNGFQVVPFGVKGGLDEKNLSAIY